MLGVDGCPGGWVGLVWGAGAPVAHVAPTLDQLIAQAETDGPLTWIGVDIPIGLADDGPRRADIAARRRLGARSASLFPTPVRSALELVDYPSAVAENRRRTGAGFSRQAYGLRSKILEVDAIVAAGEDRVFEAHPELSFTAMADGPPRWGKKTWAGLQERLALLAEQGVMIDSGLAGDTGRAGADDVVDAAAVAWTARHRAVGSARPLPDPPQVLCVGRERTPWPGAIWT